MQFPRLKLLCPQQVLILKHLLLMVLLRRGFRHARKRKLLQKWYGGSSQMLEEHALETITVHGVTFEEGCPLPEILSFTSLFKLHYQNRCKINYYNVLSFSPLNTFDKGKGIHLLSVWWINVKINPYYEAFLYSSVPDIKPLYLASKLHYSPMQTEIFTRWHFLLHI